MSGFQVAAVRFLLDEHIDPGVAAYLRAHGIDVLSAREAGRSNRRITDEEQLAFATEQGRVLVSHDADFVKPREMPQLLTGAFAGIVALRRTVSIGEQARFLRYLPRPRPPRR